MRHIELNKPELVKLDNFIKEYYGEECNAFLFQGLFVSYMSSANPLLNVTEILHGNQPPLIEMLPSENINEEFAPLLYIGLYNQTLAQNENQSTIIPMINLERVRGEYFSYVNLPSEERRNLLDWYIGYFLGFSAIWNHKHITDFLEHEDLLMDNVPITKLFLDALNAQQLILSDLIKEFKPQYSNFRLKNVVTCNKQVTAMKSDADKKIASDNAVNSGCALLASLLAISQASLVSYEELQALKEGKIVLH